MNFDWDDPQNEGPLLLLTELLTEVESWYDPYSRRLIVAVLEDAIEIFESPRNWQKFLRQRKARANEPGATPFWHRWKTPIHLAVSNRDPE
jgi:hypothetical protein